MVWALGLLRFCPVEKLGFRVLELLPLSGTKRHRTGWGCHLSVSPFGPEAERGPVCPHPKAWMWVRGTVMR